MVSCFILSVLPSLREGIVLVKQGTPVLDIGWTGKGRNEIDITTQNEVDNKIEFIEVKRQTKNFDENVLKAKSELFLKVVGSFKGYEIIYRGLSTEACNSARRVRPLFIFHLIF